MAIKGPSIPRRPRHFPYPSCRNFYTKRIARAGEELKRLHWCEAQAVDVNCVFFVSLVWVMMAPFLLDTEKMMMISSGTIVNLYIDKFIFIYVYVDIICIYFQYVVSIWWAQVVLKKHSVWKESHWSEQACTGIGSWTASWLDTASFCSNNIMYYCWWKKSCTSW